MTSVVELLCLYCGEDLHARMVDGKDLAILRF